MPFSDDAVVAVVVEEAPNISGSPVMPIVAGPVVAVVVEEAFWLLGSVSGPEGEENMPFSDASIARCSLVPKLLRRGE